MDRARLVSAQAQERRGFLDRLIGLAVVAGGFAKFFAFFVSFAAYSLWFHSWRFGLGLVLLILVHELGHVLEARRQGLPVTLPTFIPFLGAYRHPSPGRRAVARRAHRPRRPVRRRPRRGGGVGGRLRREHDLALVLANIGFLLNAFNLLPIGFLDGGTVFQSISLSRRGWIRYENGIPVEAVPPDREHANLITFLYVLLAAALVGGLLATRHSGML